MNVDNELVEAPDAQVNAHRLASGPGTPVIAVHGITANALTFGALARELDGEADLLAPDLRGRACSRGLGPPFGLQQHAEDVWASADAAGYERVRLVGHSMGGFVAAIAAARHPERVERLVLVDGGLPVPIPALARRLPARLLLKASLGQALSRLGRTFPSAEDYLEYWAAHPAVGPLLTDPTVSDPAVEAYLRHDLVPAGDGVRSSCVAEAVHADGLDVVTGAAKDAAYRALDAGVPVDVFWAPRGLKNQRRGLYNARALRPHTGRLRVRQVADSNHYSILFAPHVTRIASSLTG